MARTFVALGLFLATSIGFAGPALAQYNTQYNPQQYNPQPQYYNPQSQYNPQPQYYNPQPQYNPQSQYNPQYNGPGTYQSNQGYYPGGQPGGYQGNQTGCPYGQQFDPRQNRCVTAAAAIPSCPAGQQFDQSQNRCVYTLPGGVTVPGSVLGR